MFFKHSVAAFTSMLEVLLLRRQLYFMCQAGMAESRRLQSLFDIEYLGGVGNVPANSA